MTLPLRLIEAVARIEAALQPLLFREVTHEIPSSDRTQVKSLWYAEWAETGEKRVGVCYTRRVPQTGADKEVFKPLADAPDSIKTIAIEHVDALVRKVMDSHVRLSDSLDGKVDGLDSLAERIEKFNEGEPITEGQR